MMGKQDLIDFLSSRDQNYFAVTQIAELMGQSRTAISRIMNCLEKEGDVEHTYVRVGKKNVIATAWRIKDV